MIVYTSITKSYLPKARVLARSLKKFHPEWIFVLLYSDDLPSNFNLGNEPFDEILMIEDLGLPNLESWTFGHNIVELCTAVKGPAAELLASRKNIYKIMYLDPDIKVFNSLKDLDDLLDRYDILLTPHLLDLETDNIAIQDNEISALKHGVYNLGFFAAKTTGQGLDFIKWWSARLKSFCIDDIPNGLFTDQRWCDLAPAFFSNLYIVRDRGYNVATWNIAHRVLSKDDEGNFIVAGTPLRFYHFTGYDSGAGFSMMNKYASSQNIASELWDIYAQDLAQSGHGDLAYKSWRYSKFDNGENISSDMRKLYRKRVDLQKAFPDPYSLVEPSFLSWFQAEIKQETDLKLDTCIKKNSFIGRIKKALSNPSYGFYLTKIVVLTIKNEGLYALVRKMRNL